MVFISIAKELICVALHTRQAEIVSNEDDDIDIYLGYSADEK